MSTCSLQKIFENPPLYAENPTILLDQSLESWKNQIKPIQHSSSFTELFGELYFNETVSPKSSPLPSPKSSSSSSFPELINHANHIPNNKSLGFGSENPLSNKMKLSLSLKRLNICKESLGFESSSDEVEEFEDEEDEGRDEKNLGLEGKWLWKSGRTKRLNEYPPPISCIGRSGKPCVRFKSYRENGRFILKQIPIQDFLHAHREDGRLTLHFIQHDVEEQNFFGDKEDFDGSGESNSEKEEDYDL